MKEQIFSAELEQLKHDEDLNVLPRKLKKLREETSKDKECKILIQFITQGWPDSRKEASKFDNPRKRVFDLYWNSRDELTYEDGIKGHRIVIPAAERHNTMKSLHESHIGIEGILRRARDTVYWPGITAVLKDYISKCGICNRYRPEQCQEPLHRCTNENKASISNILALSQGSNLTSDNEFNELYKLREENEDIRNQNKNLQKDNVEITERMNNHAHTVSDLNTKIKILKDEKASLITAINLLHDDYRQSSSKSNNSDEKSVNDQPLIVTKDND